MIYVAKNGAYTVCSNVYIHLDDIEKWSDDMFECDSLIASTIAALLKKGYKTSYCCQGHIMTHRALEYEVYGTEDYKFLKSRNISLPYIMFDKEVPIEPFLKPTFPMDDWEIEGGVISKETAEENCSNGEYYTFELITDKNDLPKYKKFLIRAKDKYSDMIEKWGDDYEDLDFYQDVLFSIRRLNEFIKTLPNLKEQESLAHFEEVNLDHE